ncbi:TolC family protein [Ferrimonas sp. YFM]|uniref:TolC family protein n=1 Tax=Ferrimonas sp. YFM TaxID=3028878 RepID=UPI0025740C33|nr:TolC family protein [Ferrimonas sp. YFM]BDY05161.1 RND transporter [Ferrimonas sp. YFM]
MKFSPLWLSLALVGLSGCQALNPTDYAAPMDEAVTVQGDWQTQTQGSTATRLTELVPIAELTPLIRTSLEHNPDLAQTQLTLEILYATRQQSLGARLPSVDLSFSGEDKESASSSYSAGITVGWELDIWGKLADKDRAARLDVAAGSADLQGARDLLAANVMRSYLRLAQQQQLLNVEQSRLKVLEQNEALILSRYRRGLDNLYELDNARSNSAASRSNVTTYEEQLKEEQRTLRKLLGDRNAELPAPSHFPDVTLPLASLPEQDLSRRPDLRSAYLSTQAASERAAVAYKEMLPSLSLSATLSDQDPSFQDALFASPVWSLLGQLTAPLYRGGQLKAAAEIAELQAEQSYWTYRSTLLDAVLEVDAALSKEQQLTQSQGHLQDAVDNARRSSASYEKRYRQGLVTIQELLTVQQQQYDRESQLITATYNRLANRVDLGLALGLGVQ